MIPGIVAGQMRQDGAGGDPLWDYVTALLHFDGTNGSTTFTDVVGSTWSVLSGSPSLTTSAPKFGTASLNAVGAIGSAAGLGAGIGTGDFTIECFVNASAQTNRGVFDSRLDGSAAGVAVGHENVSGGQWQVYFGGTVYTASSLPLSIGAWVHVALERVGSTAKLYIGGTSVLSFTSAANIADTTMRVGAYYTSHFPWDSKIDEFRATVGAHRYGADFTPPSAPF